jgi:putative membrane protein insertion efficiency factor
MTAAAAWRWPSRAAVALVIVVIRVYQATLSPLLSAFGPVCRYEPSCSRYMIGALRKYGLIKGLWKGTGRLLRCHPWHPGGYDPP